MYPPNFWICCQVFLYGFVHVTLFRRGDEHLLFQMHLEASTESEALPMLRMYILPWHLIARNKGIMKVSWQPCISRMPILHWLGKQAEDAKKIWSQWQGPKLISRIIPWEKGKISPYSILKKWVSDSPGYAQHMKVLGVPPQNMYLINTYIIESWNKKENQMKKHEECSTILINTYQECFWKKGDSPRWFKHLIKWESSQNLGVVNDRYIITQC